MTAHAKKIFKIQLGSSKFSGNHASYVIDLMGIEMRLKQMDIFIQNNESNEYLYHVDYRDFKLFNSNIKKIARKKGGFMVSGKVGACRRDSRVKERSIIQITDFENFLVENPHF